MARLYANYIKAGKMTIEQVNPYWRAAVEALLAEEE